VENPIFHIVDVFAEEKYAGNQLAVFRGVGHLPDASDRMPCVPVSTGEERGRRD
jgi:predicted PhzF superfamily epimerase YddE/YHI9